MKPDPESRHQQLFLEPDPDASNDPHDRLFQLIGRMLARTRPRDDNQLRMQILRQHFDTPDALFNSNVFMLHQMGVHKTDALLLTNMYDLCRFFKRDLFPEKPRLATLEEASEFIAVNFYGLQFERFYLFCLDRRGHMKHQVLLHEGTEDGTLFSLRKLLSQVMQAECTAVIIAHNHPRRTLRPSQEDIDCTLEILNALATVGIPLLDHLIVAESRVVSMRDNGFIPAELWMRQNPDSRLLKNWLLPPQPPKPRKPKAE